MQTSNAVPKCQYCGSAFPHVGVCPTVKAIEYYQDGTVKRVELKTANDYPPLKDQGPFPVTCGAQTSTSIGATNFHPTAEYGATGFDAEGRAEG